MPTIKFKKRRVLRKTKTNRRKIKGHILRGGRPPLVKAVVGVEGAGRVASASDTKVNKTDKRNLRSILKTLNPAAVKLLPDQDVVGYLMKLLPEGTPVHPIIRLAEETMLSATKLRCGNIKDVGGVFDVLGHQGLYAPIQTRLVQNPPPKGTIISLVLAYHGREGVNKGKSVTQCISVINTGSYLVPQEVNDGKPGNPYVPFGCKTTGFKALKDVEGTVQPRTQQEDIDVRMAAYRKKPVSPFRLHPGQIQPGDSFPGLIQDVADIASSFAA
jgi:hypothetical protein